MSGGMMSESELVDKLRKEVEYLHAQIYAMDNYMAEKGWCFYAGMSTVRCVGRDLCDCFEDPRKGNVYIDPPELFAEILPPIQLDSSGELTSQYVRRAQYKFESWVDEHDRELREAWEKRDEPKVYEPYPEMPDIEVILGED